MNNDNQISENVFSEAVDNFKQNVDSVHKLAEFDRVVLEFAIQRLEKVEEVTNKSKIMNPRMTVTKALDQLRNIRSNDSLRLRYEHIFNQCIVLLVSYFGVAVKDIFERGIGEMIREGQCDNLMNEEFKITAGELSEVGQDLHNHLGALLIRKKDISFQDMQSIARAFGSYCGYSPDKDEDVNNIIAGQACRHVIVHSGAVVTKKCVQQTSKVTPRTLKKTLVVGETVKFTVDEIRILSESMIRYVDGLVVALAKVLQTGKDALGT